MEAESGLVPGRLARGSRCFGAWVGHELVGYGWLSVKPEWIGEVELEIAPGKGEAYIWNCVTLARHRRKGVFRSLVTAVVSQARTETMSKLWIASVGDLASNALESAGFVKVMRFDTGSRLGFRWLRVRMVDGVDASLHAAAGEVMAVKAGQSVRRIKRRRH
jgi:GNAT superfamily N-acetyltransferase